jgi:hypothetical protein
LTGKKQRKKKNGVKKGLRFKTFNGLKFIRFIYIINFA